MNEKAATEEIKDLHLTGAAPSRTNQARAPRTLPWPGLLSALATAGLLYACYFPLAWGWLAWVALVPLLTLVRSRASKKRLFLLSWVSGLVFFWGILQWMRHADPMMYATWALLATYCSLYFPLAILLTRFLDQRTHLPLGVTFPIVWVALEFVRAHLATGFGWYSLAYTQHEFLTLIQLTDLTGVWGVSLLVAAMNAVLFELLASWSGVRHFLALREPVAPCVSPPSILGSRGRVAVQVVGLALLLTATLIYGGWRLGQESFARGPRVALVQSNLDIRLKNEAWSAEPGAKNAAEAMRRHYIRLTQVAQTHKPDLIVWPETSWPDEWVELIHPGSTGPAPAPDSLKFARSLAAEWRTPMLIGLNTLVIRHDDQHWRYNSALLISAEGDPVGRYDKIHCVPFGEYLPFREVFPWMTAFSPYEFDYSITPGERLTRFPLGDSHFGVLICYEDTVTYLARRYLRSEGDGPRVDFFFNTTNDGWFDGSAEHEEHLAVSRFRAIETRRTVARAVNMGVSAIITPNGRVLAPTRQDIGDSLEIWDVDAGGGEELPPVRWREFKKTAGVLLASLPIDTRVPLYSLWGDWLPWSCCLLLGIGVIAGRVASCRASTSPQLRRRAPLPLPGGIERGQG